MVSKADMAMMASQLFSDYDKNNSGSLERSEVKEILTTLFGQIKKEYDVSEEKMNKMFSACDINSDNKLDKKEFLTIVQLFLQPVYL